MIPAISNIGVLALAQPIQRTNSLARAYDNIDVLASPPLLAPRTQHDTLNASNSGSIAVHIMRSMRSLAHISSWAQLKTDQVDAQGSFKTKQWKDQWKEMAKVKKEMAKVKKEDKKTRQEEGKEGEGGYTSHSCRLWH
jgi:hypothetical protein